MFENDLTTIYVFTSAVFAVAGLILGWHKFDYMPKANRVGNTIGVMIGCAIGWPLMIAAKVLED